jgi:hypothetical protein
MVALPLPLPLPPRIATASQQAGAAGVCEALEIRVVVDSVRRLPALLCVGGTQGQRSAGSTRSCRPRNGLCSTPTRIRAGSIVLRVLGQIRR